ncbi:DUF411 domain-containing protein [Azospirillum sp. RWY-5-1]|uniref:DUF411 domain-containing protein n=1 Tax=Azospirillum oleiclasticum TaxID=2735135 RepID=A0ABX2TGM4_9PROT|nr:DUF411 domain-containing protein [Azospirillum oleiclasticum]NYZ14840.1 DUF411 domain-containing protein [Azospirillum oleiclasticum]NYZ22174.1 DUF411 domain-containing protein [Azospirillum oleiclasticum]
MAKKRSGGVPAAVFGAVLLGAAVLGGVTISGGGTPAAAQEVEVWKSPACGCCGGWVKHMEAAGFTLKVHTIEDVDPVKAANGVPDTLMSCHTAVVDGYVVEGHVPAGDIRRLLAKRPKAKGLSAPGMPQSSPGMDMPGQPYDVIVFGTPEGNTIYAGH